MLLEKKERKKTQKSFPHMVSQNIVSEGPGRRHDLRDVAEEDKDFIRAWIISKCPPLNNKSSGVPSNPLEIHKQKETAGRVST